MNERGFIEFLAEPTIHELGTMNWKQCYTLPVAHGGFSVLGKYD